MSNNKSISPHLNKLHDSTSLSKDIIKIIQVYLLPDHKELYKIKRKYNYDLQNYTSDIILMLNYYDYIGKSSNTLKYRNGINHWYVI